VESRGFGEAERKDLWQKGRCIEGQIPQMVQAPREAKEMDGTGDHHVDKLSSKTQISCFCSYVESRPKRLLLMIIKMGHGCKRSIV
jgi:hypothetical protein